MEPCLEKHLTKIASVVNIPDNKANDDNSGEDDDEDDEEEILDDEDMTEDEEEDSEEEEDCEDIETSVKSKERRRIKASCSFLNDEAEDEDGNGDDPGRCRCMLLTFLMAGQKITGSNFSFFFLFSSQTITKTMMKMI